MSDLRELKEKRTYEDGDVELYNLLSNRDHRHISVTLSSNSNRALAVSKIGHYLTDTYAVGHTVDDDGKDVNVPDSETTVEFVFEDWSNESEKEAELTNAKSLADIIPVCTVYETASIEDWGDVIKLKIGL